MSGQVVEQWPIKRLGDVCSFQGGSQPPKSNFIQEPKQGYVRLLQIRDFTSDSKAVYIPEDLAKRRCEKTDIMIGRYGASVGQIHRGKEGSYNVALIKTIPDLNLINRDYFYYYLQSPLFQEPLRKVSARAAQAGFSKGDINDFEIPLPSLEEQQQIVNILDEAFAKINNSKGQLEQKLAGAKEIYFSVIHSQEGDKAPLGNFVNIKTGKLNSNAAVEGGQYPFFTCSRKPSEIDHYAFDCEAILLAGNNASGDFNVKHYSGKFNAYQRTYIITISDEQKLTYRYLYHQMVKSLKELKSSSVGTATKFLKLGMIKDLQINLPSLDKQITLQEQIDKLGNESRKLEKNYLCGLEMLDEFKQSILQEAFNGTL